MAALDRRPTLPDAIDPGSPQRDPCESSTLAPRAPHHPGRRSHNPNCGGARSCSRRGRGL